jgi:hypothetical protein
MTRHTTTTVLRATAAALAAGLAGCATATDPTGPHPAPVPDEVVAAATSSDPILDGVADDDAWRGAAETVIRMEAVEWKFDATVRAAVREGTLHLLVRWPDTTEDRAHKVWTPQPDGSWAAGPEREDVLAVGFPISGEFTGDMTSPVECVWDVWQWKSARTDPAGFSMDKTHGHTFADPGGKRHAHDLGDGRTLHIVRPEDAGRSATKSLPKPAGAGAQTPQYAAQAPDGSAADVRARGRWADGWWTVELSRALSTGHADDADFGARATVPFALAILDRAEDEHHAVSGPLVLRLR